MKISALTTFPEIIDSYMSCSIMKRSQDKNIVSYNSYDLREWTDDLRHTTDDKPYGGGPGQLMMCEPIFRAYDDIAKIHNESPLTIICAPHGKKFEDKDATFLSKQDSLLFVCGHYEGIDERVYSLADKIYSVGDYVLTGGELASMVIIDAVVRKIPGVLGAEDGLDDESFNDGLLEYPQYTRPADFRGMKVPDVLLSGNHKKIDEWKKQQSLERTKKYRPDLIS